MKKILLLLWSFIFFSFLLLALESYFFWVDEAELNRHIEENYIEPNLEQIEKEIEQEVKNREASMQSVETDMLEDTLKLTSASQVDYIYIPENYSQKIITYSESLKTFFQKDFIANKIEDMDVELHEKRDGVRWKMKNKTVKLFWVDRMEVDECNAVGIHEYAHYVDLYHFERGIFKDMSDEFYKISWDATKIIKAWQTQKDFVSGYAMTNKYEDFAETFTYYTLHNRDFLHKVKDSKVLREKYIFFMRYVFRNKEFTLSDFSDGNTVLNYYRDITKIDFSLEKFLEFLKNSL